MFEFIKESAGKIIKSRLFIISIIMVVLFGILLQRVFVLQIANGSKYEEEYALKTKKERQTSGTRGSIFDRKGVLLAYNELSYSVTLEDSGTYKSSEKNHILNQEIQEIIRIIEENGDAIVNDFFISMDEQGKYSYLAEGTSLQRNLADVYGKKKIEDLKYDNTLLYDQAKATPEQVVDYLRSVKKFDIKIEGVDEPTADDIKDGKIFYSKEDAYKILTIRYALFQNNFQKYILTTVARDVSEKTVAVIKENSDHLVGADIDEDTTRKYVNSKYFSHIIGYTGKISQNEYDDLSLENAAYELTDIIGKSGIEAYMEQDLQGTKGKEEFFVDNLGRILEFTEQIDASSGNNIYLSIDNELQIAVYNLLEQQIAGIVHSSIKDKKEYNATANASASDIIIPVYDVYFALIDNNVINTNAFEQEGASETERAVYQAFVGRQASVLDNVYQQLNMENPPNYEDLEKEMQVYMSYILSMLTEKNIFKNSAVDTEDEVYIDWKNDKISLATYLRHGISKDWIDVSQFETDSKYSDSAEIYEALINYIRDALETDQGFSKKIYKYMIHDDVVTGRDLCLILFDQEILAQDNEAIANLSSGNISSFNFIKEKIKNLEITPAQLALDPCTGSSVIINQKTGELLACVSYPGYDTNRLANTVDTEYYNSLREDASLPMYNNATQQQTAPGSTFKPVTAAAGLTEGIITPETQILDKGIFEEVQNGPKCWIYPSTHGNINVSEAIRESCNYFFYTVGYRLSGANYDEKKGVSVLDTYARMFGLGENTGIEITESKPKISDEFPITSSIGQGNHNYTTTELARYATAIASRGNVYQLTLLDKMTDSEGNLIENYEPEIKSTINEVSDTTWDAIQSGMSMMVEKNDIFDSFPENFQAAGKTGTVQQTKTRPNHAVFIGYANYNNLDMAIATRIAYGYTSANAAEVSKSIMDYYFDLVNKEELLDGQAQDIGSRNNSFTD